MGDGIATRLHAAGGSLVIADLDLGAALTQRPER